MPFVADDPLEDLFAHRAVAWIFRHEREADAVVAESGKFDAILGRLAREELVRHLQKNARAVAGVGFAPAGPAMFEVVEYLQGLENEVMRRAVLEVDDEADSASVVFVCRVVETLFSGSE